MNQHLPRSLALTTQVLAWGLQSSLCQVFPQAYSIMASLRPDAKIGGSGTRVTGSDTGAARMVSSKKRTVERSWDLRVTRAES